MTSIRLEHVTKRFKELVAVDDVSMEVADGEFLVILGASGSGKSTVLRIIAGLEVQTSGHVFIGDTQVDDYEPRDRNIAMVFQSYALYPHLTIFNNIAFGLRFRDMPDPDRPGEYRRLTKPEIDERVRAIATLLDIADTLTRKPAQLSGGQRQRVALARAIVRDPEAFLLDEPLSNLDAKIRSSARIELKRIHERLKQTFVFVTHDQSEAMTLADRLAIVHHGKLLQCDTPERVLSHPLNRYVASFVGSPEMVFLEGAMQASADGPAFAKGDLRIPLRRAPGPGPVTLGLRPWDIGVSRTPMPGGVAARVVGVERLGSTDQLFLAVGALELRALVRAYDHNPGDAVFLGFDPDRALFFDQAGERVEPGERPTPLPSA